MAGTINQGGARSGAGRWRPAVWGGAGLMLLAPFVAMRFTAEVAWSGGDFVVFGMMLFAVCAAYEFAAADGGPAHRAGVLVALGAAFLLVWGNLAVGFIGSEDNPANLMFLGVLAVGGIGALIARVRPRGMVWAMSATACAQVWVAIVAFALGLGSIFALTAVFAALWLISAWLFSLAGRGA